MKSGNKISKVVKMKDTYKSKFARLMVVLRAIKQNENLTRNDLCRLCGGVSKKTVSRYLDILRNVFNYPIIFNREKGSYELYHQNYNDIETKKLSIDEIILMIMALDSLKNLSGPEILNLKFKLFTYLPGRFREKYKKMRTKLGLNDLRQAKGRIINIDKISKAILKEKIIKFDYYPAYLKKEKMKCEVMPYGVNWDNDKCYLIGKDVEDDKIITYRIDRLENVLITEKEGKIPDDFNLEEYVARSWKMFHGEPQEVILCFDNFLLPLVKDKFEPGYYEIIERNENEFIIKTTIIGIKGLKIWLLSLGDDVEVIKPESLKKEIIETAKKVLEKYKNKEIRK